MPAVICLQIRDEPLALGDRMAGRKKKLSKSRVPSRQSEPIRGRKPTSADAALSHNGPPSPAEAVAVVNEVPLAPIERERSAYDGDTAIKLYLREIGQV